MSEKLFLIWSNEHSAWWRPGHMGYNTIIGLAGRYCRPEAERICRNANEYPPPAAKPNEVMVLAPEYIDD